MERPGASWGVLGASWRPKRTKNGLKKNPPTVCQPPMVSAFFFGRAIAPLALASGGSWPPRRPKRPPRELKSLPRGPQEAPRWRQEAPRWDKITPRAPQEGPKRAPRGPQDGSKSLPSRILHRLHVDLTSRTRQKAPETTPGPPLDPPKVPQDGLKRAPRGLQEAPKMAPRGSFRALWSNLELIRGGNVGS